MKKINFALKIGLFLTSLLSFSGCDKGTTKKTYEYTRDNFFGICALTGEVAGGVDKGLTNDWTARNIKAMGFKSQRFWISLDSMFSIDENDEPHVIQSYYKIQRDYVSKCCNAGIKLGLVMFSSFATPYGVHYDNGYSVPDPEEDPELYGRWLNVNGRCAAKLKELFPEFNVFEPGNEPDFANASCIHKDGYIWMGDYGANVDYLFNDEVKANIILDLCYYVRKYVKEVDPTTRVSIPGLTNLDTTPDFLDTMYRRIESKTLPYGTEYSDTEPDHYFDVLNWHPYSKVSPVYGALDEDWLEYNKMMYQIAIDHGDEGKPVLFSELGWTTMDRTGNTEVEASRLIGELIYEGAKTIQKEMPYVEAVFYFRLTNLYYQVASDNGGEEHFGLFYHPDDPEHLGAPREAAKRLAQAINGDDYVLEDHLEPYVSPTR